MRKSLFATLVLLVPFALFAQTATAAKGMDKESDLLRSLKLSDMQISQVKETQKALVAELRSDRAHLQLINAQIKVALLPSSASPDLTAVNNLIDQKAQLRAGMQKAFVSTRLKLIGIMGQDNLNALLRFRHERFVKRAAFSKNGAWAHAPAGFGGELSFG
jgi:hypothetical protein